MTIVDKLSSLLAYAKTGEEFWIQYTTGKRSIVHFGPNGQLYTLNANKTYEPCLLVLGYVEAVQPAIVLTAKRKVWYSRILSNRLK